MKYNKDAAGLEVPVTYHDSETESTNSFETSF